MSIPGSADLTKTLPTGILIPSMSELEPLMGSQAAWRKTRKALILLAGLLNAEHSEVGMLDEILTDAELTAVLAPAPLARQDFHLTLVAHLLMLRITCKLHVSLHVGFFTCKPPRYTSCQKKGEPVKFNPEVLQDISPGDPLVFEDLYS